MYFQIVHRLLCTEVTFIGAQRINYLLYCQPTTMLQMFNHCKYLRKQHNTKYT